MRQAQRERFHPFIQRAHAATHLLGIYTRLGDTAKATAMAQTANALVEELGHRELKAQLTYELAALYRLSGQGQTAIPFANEAMQLAKQTERANFHARLVLEALLLHLFHTANAPQAARMAQKALARLSDGDSHPFDRMMLTLALAVAEFRQSRTSRPEAVRILQEGLAECSRRGYELELLRIMHSQLPQAILQHGITLIEQEARLVPAAWQALPDQATRAAFSTLLSPGDRRRVLSLASGPAPLRIQSLGPLAVTVGAEPLDMKALKKRKAGVLLVLLLSQHNPFPREQVVDRLWPDLDADAADTSLRVTLHHLRRLLEPHLGGRTRYIQAEGGLICFSRQPEVDIDLDHFAVALMEANEAAAVGNVRLAAGHYEAACKIYRGDLSADDPYSAALEDLRSSLRERYTTTLDWLGAHYWHEAQDYAKAILIFKQRLVLDEAHEPAHQSLIRIYLENGQVTSARQQYAACRDSLRTLLDVAPSRATDSLLQLAISMESEAVSTGADSKPARVVRRR